MMNLYQELVEKTITEQSKLETPYVGAASMNATSSMIASQNSIVVHTEGHR